MVTKDIDEIKKPASKRGRPKKVKEAESASKPVATEDEQSVAGEKKEKTEAPPRRVRRTTKIKAEDGENELQSSVSTSKMKKTKSVSTSETKSTSKTTKKATAKKTAKKTSTAEKSAKAEETEVDSFDVLTITAPKARKKRGRPTKAEIEARKKAEEETVETADEKKLEVTNDSVESNEVAEEVVESEKKVVKRRRGKPTTTYVNSLVGMVEVSDEPMKRRKNELTPMEELARAEGGEDESFLRDDLSKIDSERTVPAGIKIISKEEADAQNAGGMSESKDDEESDDEKETNGIEVDGIFEYADNISNTGYGFLRRNGVSSDADIYVSPMFTKKFNLRNGEYVKGIAKSEQTDKYRALMYVQEVNGVPPYMTRSKYRFDDMTPLFPRERFHLSKNGREIAMRIIDLIAPVGKGQRGLIVAPPKSGKTILLQKIARSIRDSYPEVELMILLIDERPEEVTDMKEVVNAPVYYSTFDELPQNHIRIAELVLSRARGLVEMGKDVVILLDSITRLARAYNIAMPASGRTLSGGLDTNALHKPKRFLGSARNMAEGGSLTIMATALIETGSKMDDVIFEEFKGTGNLELILDRKLSEKRIFPSIDIKRSGTRREELLLNKDEYEAIMKLRRALDQNRGRDPVELLSEELMKTRNNEELVKWINNVFMTK